MTENQSSDSTLQYLAARLSSGSRVSRLLSLYAASGALMAVLGFGYLAYSRLKIELSAEDQVALIAGIGGTVFAVLSYALQSYRKNLMEAQAHQYEQYSLMAKFLDAWDAFERESKRAAFGEAADDTHSIRETLAVLRKDGKMMPSDIFEAEELLRVRNSLVHGSRMVGGEAVRDALERVISILSRI
ncbi:hypothetical protein [Sphingomonas melonis]